MEDIRIIDLNRVIDLDSFEIFRRFLNFTWFISLCIHMYSHMNFIIIIALQHYILTFDFFHAFIIIYLLVSTATAIIYV